MYYFWFNLHYSRMNSKYRCKLSENLSRYLYAKKNTSAIHMAVKMLSVNEFSLSKISVGREDIKMPLDNQLNYSPFVRQISRNNWIVYRPSLPFDDNNQKGEKRRKSGTILLRI